MRVGHIQDVEEFVEVRHKHLSGAGVMASLGLHGIGHTGAENLHVHR